MEEYWQTVTNALSLQVSLAIFVIYNVQNLGVGDKITVGVGIPLQLAWSILGWFAVSISGVTSGREINFFFW